MPVHNPALHCCRTVWALPRSLATTCGITFVFFSWGYLDVSVPPVSPCYTMNSCNSTWILNPGGFPHSDIHGSMAICAFPWLFAACRVLLRLLVPRHSPYALNSLTFRSISVLLKWCLFLPSTWWLILRVTHTCIDFIQYNTCYPFLSSHLYLHYIVFKVHSFYYFT